MSVLIKGMDMPKSCYECNFRLWDAFEDDDTFTCLATDGEFGTARKNERRDFCPLVEIPSHGDLIDRDELKGIIGKFPLSWEYGDGVKDCWNALLEAPTIIEAEEVKEKEK